MSTGTFLIQGALRRLQAHSVASAAETETIIVGMNKLNSMLDNWRSQGIDLSTVPIDAPGDEVSESGDSTNAIVNNLAVELELEFGALDPLSSDKLAGIASVEFNTVKNIYQTITIPRRIISSTTPMGAGNRNTHIGNGVFKGDGGSVGG